MFPLLPIVLSGLVVVTYTVHRQHNKLKKKKQKTALKSFNPQEAVGAQTRPREVVKRSIPGEQEKRTTPFPHSKTEEKCRRILEEIYGLPFPPCDQFVVNKKSNHFITLDGYNSSLKIAFEYQGEQHYKFPNFLSKQGKMTLEQFKNGIYRDRLKKAACRAAGITLLIIPYTQDKRLEEYIKSIAV